ncbi:hypothetical protein DFR24_2654 [Panacagrimonas perspica]|uniref:Uncharacterized protein n=2 Tax=Panacagrimonas perspica TaxID=381431 RepID=A0A4R7P3P7_9GAMM|nr:hypothetical protein [Panacagrimonas perspica]TDU28287.1 hypothetical protein DFR24_2654 [Panacagrimonas perspica]
MDTAMKTTFLSDEDMSHVQSILDEHGLSGFDASVRLWGRGKAIEVKGTLGRQELSCLLAIASFLGTSDEGSTDAANESALPSAAGAVMAMPAVLVDMPAASTSA